VNFRLRGEKIALTENDVEKACLDALRYRRIYPLRLHSGLFLHADRAVIEALQRAGVRYRMITVGEPGIPDYAIPRGFMEVKAPGQKVSEVQREKILTLRDHWDLKTAVITSVDELSELLARNEAW
jgi:hypothetical protein